MIDGFCTSLTLIMRGQQIADKLITVSAVSATACVNISPANIPLVVLRQEEVGWGALLVCCSGHQGTLLVCGSAQGKWTILSVDCGSD